MMAAVNGNIFSDYLILIVVMLITDFLCEDRQTGSRHL